ncbi:hypothetical protein EWM64_g1054 [Hericium alpestre]|uniref:F-box domain-containing protein n=1 Tax=Hericium alpestre TaxID=135208 RepID=A0A4Z0A9E3_9AGAM|nr:hypothetical protein EWM64_g1054 [Hericium alpestre]
MMEVDVISEACYISAMPVEVLCDIFRTLRDAHQLTEIDDTNGRYPNLYQIPISHVCRHWRNIALHLPELWTSIVIHRGHKHLERVDAFLQRSKSLPLDMVIRWCPRCYENEDEEDLELEPFIPMHCVMSILIPHVHRWRSLDVGIDIWRTMAFLLEMLWPLRAPSLRRLRLVYIPSVLDEDFNVLGDEYNPFVPFGLSGVPMQLEEVSLESVYLDWDQCVFADLKSLTYSSSYEWINPTMHHVFYILVKSPGITTFHLEAELPDIMDDHIPVVELRLLQDLEIWIPQTMLLLQIFLQHLNMPALRSFSLQDNPGWSSGELLDVLMGREIGFDWEDIPSQLLRPSILQTLLGLRIQCPNPTLPRAQRLAFWGHLQNLRVLVLDNNPLSPDAGLQTALSDLLENYPYQGNDGQTSSILLPRLTSLIVMESSSESMRPFLEGRKNAGVPLKRIYADFAAVYDHPDILWMLDNLEVVGMVDGFQEAAKGNVETWLALDAEPIGTTRFQELLASVECDMRFSQWNIELPADITAWPTAYR